MLIRLVPLLTTEMLVSLQGFALLKPSEILHSRFLNGNRLDYCLLGKVIQRSLQILGKEYTWQS